MCRRLDLWGLGLQGPISERLSDLIGLTRVCAVLAAAVVVVQQLCWV